jgi:hypothetical protein
VPTIQYNSQTQTQALPNPRFQNEAPIEAFGGGNAAKPAAEGLLESTMKVAAAEKQRFDQVNIQDYDSALSKLESDIQVKTKALRGKDAAGAMDVIDEDWRKGISELDKMLSNDAQRGAGNRLKANRYESLYKAGQVHASTELSRYELDSTNAAVSTYQNEAALNFQDPQRVASSLDRQVAVITDYAAKNGLLNSPQFEKAVSDATGKTHALVISQMLSSHQDLQAKKYFDEFKNELGDQLPVVQKQVEAGSLRGESQRVVDGIFQKNLTEEEAKGKIDSIESPELRDASMERYRQELTIRKNIQKDQYESMTHDLFNIVDQTKSLDQVVTDPRWQTISPEDKNKFRSYAKKLQEGDDIPKNSDDYYYLLRMAAEDPKEFAGRNLMLFKSTVEQSQLSHLFELQRMNNKSKKEDVLGGIRTKNSIVDGTLRELKIPPSPKPGSKEAKQANDFRRLVDEEVILREQQTGKKVTNPEVEEISKKLATEIVTEKRSFWFDKKKKVYELDVKDIPTVELGQIDAALKQLNLPITDDFRLKLYRGKLNAR